MLHGMIYFVPLHMMQSRDRDIVLGILLHAAGLQTVPQNLAARVAESISPVNKDKRIWQAADKYIGAHWIVSLGTDKAEVLNSPTFHSTSWRELGSKCIVTVDGEPAVCASFHDTKHDLSPPALLRFGQEYVYRNPSGHTVWLRPDLVNAILELNGIETP
jgi:hypothetical protein